MNSAPIPLEEKNTDGLLTVALAARMIAIRTAAISSMNTPALLISDINFTPRAFTTVVNTTRIEPSRTAFKAKSEADGSTLSPMNWNPLHSRGRFSWYASTTAEIVTIDAVSISQPDIHPTIRLPSFLDQL